jgi:hypothetical protein
MFLLPRETLPIYQKRRRELKRGKREYEGKDVRYGMACGKSVDGTLPKGMRLVERKDPHSNQSKIQFKTLKFPLLREVKRESEAT